MIHLPANGLPDGIVFIERDWLSSNHVLGLGHAETVLVDTGYVSHRQTTVAIIDRLLAGRPLVRIVNSHAHSDHVGGNAALKSRYGCEICVPAGIFDALLGWDETRLQYAALGQACERFHPDTGYASGDTLRIGDLDWRALAAPGHDMDALLLHEPGHGLLISADALWENGFGIVFPEFYGEPGFATQAATLDLIDSLDVRVVIPGHGPLFFDVRAALTAARARLAHFRTYPERHANLALRVGLVFLLLERRRMPLAGLAQHYGHLPLVERINRQFYQEETDALTRRVAAALVRSGTARIDGEALVAV